MRLPAILLSAGLLAACAHPWNVVGLPPGTSKADVVATAGPPLRVLPNAGGGERYQYTLQPMGFYAFNVDFDSAGRLVRAEQSLTGAHFSQIQVDKWTVADVEREFGPPGRIDRVYSSPGPVFTYRWRDYNVDMFYWVYMDEGGVVRRAHPGMIFLNEPNMRVR